MDLKNTRSIILTGSDPEAKRGEIRDYFHAPYDIDERLYDTLRHDEIFYRRADRLRHPLIFYFGHTATFFINKLTIAGVIDQPHQPEIRIHVRRGGGRDVLGRLGRAALRLAVPAAGEGVP